MKLSIWNKLTGKSDTRAEGRGEAPPRAGAERPRTPRISGTLSSLLEARRPGAIQRRGCLEMIPLHGSAVEEGAYAPPESALRLDKAVDYGRLVFRNRRRRPTIIPLHLGYMQRGVQNHAMCVSWVLQGQRTETFTDACCIQEAQGGYMREVEQRFIVLPHPLRRQAYDRRGQEDYSKLWDAIERFNTALGLKGRGHLDELKQHRQAELLRTVYHLEREEGQTGAVFLCGGEVVGLELAPDATFYAELHRPLVMYTYAPLRLLEQGLGSTARSLSGEMDVGDVESAAELRDAYDRLWDRRRAAVEDFLQRLGDQALGASRFRADGDHLVLDLQAGPLLGQGVLLAQRPAYVSLFNGEVLTI
jgi:hypothetical protein